MIKNLVFHVYLILLLICSFETKAEISEEALFYRCYYHLTNKRPARNHPSLDKVRSDSSAIDECIKLLNETVFEGEKLKSLKITPDSEILDVVKNFHTLHRSWFQTEEYFFKYGEISAYETNDVQEGALYFTNTLFKSSVPFSSIVQKTKSLRSIRHSEQAEYNGQDRLFSARKLKYFEEIPGFFYTQESKNPILISPPKVELGKLIGITDQQDFTIPVSWGGGPYYLRADSGYLADEEEFLDNLNLYNHLGSGIIGSASYLLQNDNAFQLTIRKNGALKTGRRWSKHVFKDLLCRDLPVLREDDTNHLVDVDSNLSFRGSRNCMACHATMDPLARTIRNTRRILSTPVSGVTKPIDKARPLALVHSFEVDKPTLNENWPEEDIYWHRRPPIGSLYFRQYDGNLVNKNVNSLPEVGDTLASLDDIYVCAAKRYYEHFTGVKANISDLHINPITDGRFKAKELLYRDFVIKLGRDLKKHQNVKLLIEAILKSEGYKYPGQRIE